ncbi:MAG: hypothetical protein ACOYJQ_13265 [Pseudochelatococcus sp.]|jgi:hypothetical protein|uniref:type III secretion apparatus assembly protein SctX n=1 Tax=Pseudochelatococcus sp. TaxID=2020869 RepID=UPI003D90780B
MPLDPRIDAVGHFPRRVEDLDIGIESISRWRVRDEFHLPQEPVGAPAWKPAYRPLHDVLHRPTLDERLPDLLQPATVAPELMAPAGLADTRLDVRTLLAAHIALSDGPRRAVLEQALDLIDGNLLLDAEVRASLAALYRG